MTLIELIMAIAIAGIVIAIASSIFITVRTAVSGQSSRGKRRIAMASSMQHVADDLARMVNVDSSELCSLELKTARNSFSTVSFCGIHSEASAQDVDLRWFEHHRITYRTSGDGPQKTLERVTQPVIGPDSLEGAKTNVMARDIQSFAVSIYDGEAWQTTWPGEDEDRTPVAARIELAAGEGSRTEEMVTEVIVPGGTIYSSTVVRSSSSP